MKRLSATIHIFPVALIVLGIIACALSAYLIGAGGDFAGLLLLISITTLLGGGVLGFLFGIPKVNKEYDPGDNYTKKRKYSPNTNLEEISDWLTKIIIGIGLTQLIRIPELLRNLADSILSHVDCGRMNCDLGHPLLIAVILYFLISGFIIGYFYTRLFLPNLFEMMEEDRVKEAEIAIWRAGAKNAPSLSKEERKVLDRIKEEGEAFPLEDQLHPNERAAVNTLAAKGIIEWKRGGSSGKQPIMRVADQKLLDKLE